MTFRSFILAAALSAAALNSAQAESIFAADPGAFDVAVGGLVQTQVGCAKGFNKVSLVSDHLGWHTLICQTPIIQCPGSIRPTVSLVPEIINLGMGDVSTRYRFKYTCIAYTPAG
jgi:hypothetical protein